MGQNAILNWSSGKDCALALYELQNKKDYQVKTLFTTLNKNNQRVSMHGTQEELLKKQAEALDLPIELLYIEENISMEDYSKKMASKLLEFKELGISVSAFGDILLEDLKVYRENQLNSIGMQSVFPLWKIDTTEIIKRFVRLGFKAIVIAVSSKYFSEDFLGTEIDEDFIGKLPKGVDACGENGEFHTFCYDGPIFKRKLEFKKGIIKSNKYPDPLGKGSIIFHFLELLPL